MSFGKKVPLWALKHPRFIGSDSVGLIESSSRLGGYSRRFVKNIKCASVIDNPLLFMEDFESPFGKGYPQVMAALYEANGNRKVRRLSLGQVVEGVYFLTQRGDASGGSVFWLTGGSTSHNWYSPKTTCALCWKAPSGAYWIGIKEVPSYLTSFGRAWKDLRRLLKGTGEQDVVILKKWVENREANGLMRIYPN